MDIAQPELFYTDRLRCLRRAVGPAILASLCGVVATGDGEVPAQRAALIAGCVLLALVAIVRLWPALPPRRPALVLADDGFRAPSLAAGLVPWTAVAHATPVFGKRSAALVLSLHPGAETSFVPSIARRLRLRLGLARRSHLALDLARLEGEPRPHLRRIETRIRAARGLAAEASLRLPQPAAVAEGPPVFAYALIGLLLAIVAAEVAFAIKPGMPLDVATLGALGGSSRAAVVGRGEWWRLVTASLLHGGVLHIFFNTVALVYAARLLERLIGWRWFAADFALGAVGGSLLSVALNGSNIIGVGASGGIVGLSATTGLLAFRFPMGARRNRLLAGALSIVIPAMLPVLSFSDPGKQKVDVAAHAGGAIVGALVGLFLLNAWRKDEVAPPFGRIAALVAAAYFAVAAGSLVPIAGDYATIKAAVAALAPNVPSDDKHWSRFAEEMIDKYPRDPRVRYFHASNLTQRGDLLGAQRDLETAMRDKAMLRPEISRIEPFLRGLLAIVLSARKRQPEADALVAGHCAEMKSDFADGFAQFGLCR